MLGAGEGQANPGQTSPNEDFHVGWVAGGGVEYAYTDNMTLKFEYLHMDFDQYEALNANGNLYTFEDKVDLVRVGLNYKF